MCKVKGYLPALQPRSRRERRNVEKILFIHHGMFIFQKKSRVHSFLIFFMQNEANEFYLEENMICFSVAPLVISKQNVLIL